MKERRYPTAKKPDRAVRRPQPLRSSRAGSGKRLFLPEGTAQPPVSDGNLETSLRNPDNGKPCIKENLAFHGGKKGSQIVGKRTIIAYGDVSLKILSKNEEEKYILKRRVESPNEANIKDLERPSASTKMKAGGVTYKWDFSGIMGIGSSKKRLNVYTMSVRRGRWHRRETLISSLRGERLRAKGVGSRDSSKEESAYCYKRGKTQVTAQVERIELENRMSLG